MGCDTRSMEGSARTWLSGLGIPCWTSPDPPGERGRYGLLLWDRRRILVAPISEPAAFDAMAAARCHFCLLMAPVGRAWRPAGFYTLEEASALPPWRPPAPVRAASGLPEAIGRPRSRLVAALLGTLSLLVAGEPDPPPCPRLESRTLLRD